MALRLASFKANGRTSYGAVTDSGIVDLGKKLSKYPTLRDVFRAGAVGEARAAASGAADYQVKDVTMLPPMPAFYNHPQSIDDVVNHIVMRVLDQFGISAPNAQRWDGHMHTAAKIVPVPPAAVKSGS